MEFENKDLCAKCQGKCCKKCGCDYFINDFVEINKNSILKILETNNVSIVSALKSEYLPNGKKVLEPFLYLRARNVDRGVVDLLSLKKRCSLLTDTGCLYSLEKRPSGGVNLIPDENGCYQLVNQKEAILKWGPYQNLLSKIVKRLTGKTVLEVFENDIENMLYEFINKKFEKFSETEIEEVIPLIKDFANLYPHLLYNANIRSGRKLKLKK